MVKVSKNVMTGQSNAKRTAASSKSTRRSAAKSAGTTVGKGTARAGSAVKRAEAKTVTATRKGRSPTVTSTGRVTKTKVPTRRQRKVKTGIEVGAVEPIIATVRETEPHVRLGRIGPMSLQELRLLDELVTDADEITIVGKNDRRLSITGPLLDALAKFMGALNHGATVTVMGAEDTDTELTSQEAANLLNVSRPYVVKLAREGALPHRRVGNRHRFTLADVLEYREQMRAITGAALAELAPADSYTAADF
jgi:excisionase family DNA binding protein